MLSQAIDGRYSSKEINRLDMMFDPINFINKEFNRLHTNSSIEIDIKQRDSTSTTY